MDRDQKTLLAAQGYAELGMFDDALAELYSLPEDSQKTPAALEMRAAIIIQARRWPDALVASEALCQTQPTRNSGFIHAAYCLHELGRTVEARDTLLQGPPTLHEEATYHYNLACYECALGQLALARAHLEKSFEIDKKFREFAKTDPDLKALRSG
jgi:predicted Zn-dependent protease